ncbi:MAG: hypothetical protein ACRDGR_04380, partial [bacterium]
MITSRLACLLFFLPPLSLGGSGARKDAASASETATEAAGTPTISEVAVLAREHHAAILAVQSRLAPDRRVDEIVAE